MNANQEQSEFIAIGYVIIQGYTFPASLRSDLPAVVFTPTTCVCDFHPASKALTWINDAGVSSEETNEEYRKNLSMDIGTFLSLQIDAEEAFNQYLWGLDETFSNREAAVKFYQKYFQHKGGFKLIEIALPHNLLMGFREAAAPPPPNATPTGVRLAAQQAQSALEASKILGFETLGVHAWGDLHTSVCYDVRGSFAKDAGVTFNEEGHISNLEAARRGAELNNNAEGGSVGDAIWFPVRLAELVSKDLTQQVKL